jgi:hypothetical protein
MDHHPEQLDEQEHPVPARRPEEVHPEQLDEQGDPDPAKYPEDNRSEELERQQEAIHPEVDHHPHHQ